MENVGALALLVVVFEDTFLGEDDDDESAEEEEQPDKGIGASFGPTDFCSAKDVELGGLFLGRLAAFGLWHRLQAHEEH